MNVFGRAGSVLALDPSAAANEASWRAWLGQLLRDWKAFAADRDKAARFGTRGPWEAKDAAISAQADAAALLNGIRFTKPVRSIRSSHVANPSRRLPSGILARSKRSSASLIASSVQA